MPNDQKCSNCANVAHLTTPGSDCFRCARMYQSLKGRSLWRPALDTFDGLLVEAARLQRRCLALGVSLGEISAVLDQNVRSELEAGSDVPASQH